MASRRQSSSKSGSFGSNSSSFVAQAAILASAGLFVRAIGFLYRLPMYNMMGDEGMGIYAQGYNAYNFLLVLSSAGLPAAISRMVSARFALNQHENAHKVFKVSLAYAAGIGFLGSILLFFGAGAICDFIGSPRAYYSMLALAPTLVITAVLSVFRGYFQGMNNSVPTALSQLVEQIVNAIFSIWLVYIFYGQSLDYAAAGGTAATGIGAFFGLVVIVSIFFMARQKINKDIYNNRIFSSRESNSFIAKELVFTAFPIIAGTAIFSVANIIDSSMVTSRLMHNNVFTDVQALEMFGRLNQKFVTITTLPVAISTSMSTAAIPGISAAVAKKDFGKVTERINLAVRLAMVICIPAAMGIGVFGNQILYLLFPGAPEGGILLQVGAVSVVFLALSQICTGVLQGIGQVKVPVFAALMGCIAKVITNYVLIAIPSVNIIGAVIGTIVCYAVAAPINMYYAYQYANARPDYIGIFVKPGICAIIMGAVCFISYYTIYYIYPSNVISLMLAIVIGVLIYFLLMTLTGGVTSEDFNSIPMGGKLLDIVRQLGVDVQ